jgi:hypothetical protein
MSHIEHVWDALDRCVRQCVPVPTNIQQLRTAIEEEWDNTPQDHNHRPDQLYPEDVSRCMKQMVVTPDTDWFSDP